MRAAFAGAVALGEEVEAPGDWGGGLAGEVEAGVANPGVIY